MSDNNNFEFDKLFGSIILGLFVLVFSINVGGIIYPLKKFVAERGYAIDISSIVAAETSQSGIPDEIDITQIFTVFDVTKGEQVFKKCSVCHTNTAGGANKVGPNLWNILNSKVAIRDGFAYSNAMLAKGNDGDSWTYEELYRYLYSPKRYVPGTKMAFAGLKKDEDRVNLIMYLRTLAESPIELP